MQIRSRVKFEDFSVILDPETLTGVDPVTGEEFSLEGASAVEIDPETGTMTAWFTRITRAGK